MQELEGVMESRTNKRAKEIGNIPVMTAKEQEAWVVRMLLKKRVQSVHVIVSSHDPGNSFPSQFFGSLGGLTQSPYSNSIKQL